jgi:hypothetical protein
MYRTNSCVKRHFLFCLQSALILTSGFHFGFLRLISWARGGASVAALTPLRVACSVRSQLAVPTSAPLTSGTHAKPIPGPITSLHYQERCEALHISQQQLAANRRRGSLMRRLSMPKPLSNDKRDGQDQLEFVMIWLSVITTALVLTIAGFVGLVF